MTSNSESDATLKARLVHEVKSYAVISLYLFLCFGVVLVYEASQSANVQVSVLPLAAAVVKALVMGKFILIGEALKPGTRLGAPTLLHRVAWRTLGLLVLLIILKLLEELIIGLVHGEAVSAIVGELIEKGWLGALGPVLLMLLILIPLMFAIELNRVLGGEGLKGLLLGND